MFFKGSRYESVNNAELTSDTGRKIVYKKVRFITSVHADLGHKVKEGERLDQIAHIHLHNVGRFWRICDVNRVMWPDDLVDEAGEIILIPPSEG